MDKFLKIGLSDDEIKQYFIDKHQKNYVDAFKHEQARILKGLESAVNIVDFLNPKTTYMNGYQGEMDCFWLLREKLLKENGE